jgi:CheY-like chemotaxis protein
VGCNAELTVQDDGLGIPPDFLPQIFEPFRQADTASTRMHRGLGLGLAIVRNLVELHGGQVQAMNRHHHTGASFKVVIPTQGLPAATIAIVGLSDSVLPEVKPGTESTLKGTRVLVVDDEADSREVASMILARCGAEVHVAASASEAFELFARQMPDVLVADIEMPGEDGYSLLRRIRVLPLREGGHTPAVALTAYAGAQDRARLLDAGFHRHVPKPIQPSELISAVATLGKSFTLTTARGKKSNG